MLLALGAATVSARAASGPDLTVDTPCSPPEAAVNGVTPYRLCSIAKPEFSQQLQSRVTDIVNAYYPDANRCADPAQAGTAACMPVCNAYPGELTTIVEGNDVPPASSPNNHLGQFCGDWTAMTVTKIPGDPSVPTPDQCSVKPAAPSGRVREAALARGMWVYALDCALKGVRREVQAGTLTLRSVGGGPSPCALMGGDMNRQLLGAKAQFDAVKGSFLARQNLADTREDNCADPTKFAADNGPLRQNTCQLIATRHTIEALFLQLAACEVASRASIGYQSFRNQLSGANDVGAAIAGQMGAAGNRCALAPGQCDSTKINRCYRGIYLDLLAGKRDQAWPAGSCQ